MRTHGTGNFAQTTRFYWQSFWKTALIRAVRDHDASSQLLSRLGRYYRAVKTFSFGSARKLRSMTDYKLASKRKYTVDTIRAYIHVIAPVIIITIITVVVVEVIVATGQ